MIEIELPDGTILEAPDNADVSAVAKNYMARQQKLEAPTSNLKNIGMGVLKGASDIGTTLLRPLDATGLTGRTNQERRESLNQFFGEQADPESLAFKGGELTAGIAGTAGVGGVLAKGAGILGAAPKIINALRTGGFSLGVPAAATVSGRLANAALRTGAGAAAGGAAVGLINPEEIGTGAAIGALMPGGVKAAGAVGKGVGGLLTKKPVVPELDELKTLAGNAYAKAENAGVVVSKKSFANTVNRISDEVNFEGLDKTLHPKATAALNRLNESSGKELSFKELDVLRRVVKGAASSIEPDERRIARIMVDKLDDYMTNIKPTDVVSRDPAAAKVAAESLTEARALWSRFRKGETVEELIERAKNRAAQFSGSGYENALRTEFRNLAQNKKRMRIFTETEQEAIKRVARGGTTENAMRFIGKLAPTGIVPAALGGGAGYAVGGPIGSAALLAAGGAGRLGATLLTERNARRASELMRSGGVQPSVGLLNVDAPRTGLLDPELIQSLQSIGRAAPLAISANQGLLQ